MTISSGNLDDHPFEMDLAVKIEDDGWPFPANWLETRCEEAAKATFSALHGLRNLKTRTEVAIEISIVFANDAFVQDLNRDYRQKDQPTNVLSFPDTPLDKKNLELAASMTEPLILGDILLARETVEREAVNQNKDLADHMTHLLVHGLLHLAGYDHMEQNEAEVMENLEVSILDKLGVPDPYILS